MDEYERYDGGLDDGGIVRAVNLDFVWSVRTMAGSGGFHDDTGVVAYMVLDHVVDIGDDIQLIQMSLASCLVKKVLN